MSAADRSADILSTSMAAVWLPAPVSSCTSAVTCSKADEVMKRQCTSDTATEMSGSLELAGAGSASLGNGRDFTCLQVPLLLLPRALHLLPRDIF